MEPAAHRRGHRRCSVVAPLEQSAITEEVEREKDFGLDELHAVERVGASQRTGHGKEDAFEVLWLLGDKFRSLRQSESPKRNNV